MARNEEKANSLMNRWTTMKQEFILGSQERRPFIVSDVHSLPEAEKWRRQVVKEVSKKVAEIQNAGLGEHVIRDLNDRINKLLREKHRWECRIIELGGANYKGGMSFDAEGDVLQALGGYKYFGAAKDLPGVRELFEQRKEDLMPKRTRQALLRDLEPDYYGFRDDDDGVLVSLEKEEEKLQIHNGVEAWKAEKRANEEALKMQDIQT